MTLHVGFANHICVQSFIPVHWLFFLYFFIKHVFNIFLFVNVFFYFRATKLYATGGYFL